MSVKRIIVFLIFLLILFALLQNISLSKKIGPWWNYDWEYSQEIVIPVNSGIFHAKYQPIDIRINFNNPCRGNNEIDHLVIVVYYKGIELLNWSLKSMILNIPMKTLLAPEVLCS